jgi:hypothetical protein
MFDHYIQPVVDFVREHQAWAAPIVFALAFMESLAFISLLVPAWGALTAHSDGLEVTAAFFFRLRSIAPTMLE